MPAAGVVMIVAVVLMCIFPEIATWLPDAMMGAKAR